MNLSHCTLRKKGQSNIPKESRIHLEVIFPLVSGVPSKFLFFNKAWTVGKVLDVIASEGNIINKNNVAGEEVLLLVDYFYFLLANFSFRNCTFMM